MNKSGYEDYLETSKYYDQTREPNGVDIILGGFASLDLPLNQQTILDAGCGTGNYLKALYGKIGHLHGIEVNHGMLTKARIKLNQLSNVKFTRNSILELPYKDETFDGIMCNQVIHHLETKYTQEYFSNLRKFLEEVYRTLRSPGVICINTCSQQQIYDGFWWTELIPQAMRHMAKKYITIKDIRVMLKDVGFKLGNIIVSLDETIQRRELYFNPRGPLQKNFRDGDSTWSLSPKEEITQALDKIYKMNKDGSIDDYINQRDKLRRNVGQTLFVLARKVV